MLLSICSRSVKRKSVFLQPRRTVSKQLQNKIARNKRKQEKDLEQLSRLEETTSQKKITTELSSIEYEIDTKPGEKKDVHCPLPPTYSSKFVEACWYHWWEKEGFFKAVETKRECKENDVFSMVIPPPNVTGRLHLGHALTVALEDVLCRWNRMKGREVVWVPGCDHAGIATQAVVEKLLATRNISRHQLGRERFLEEVWKWKDAKESQIYDQLRVLGASLDWTKTNFTLSTKLSYAVREAFIRLHERDLIVRKKSLVNWSSSLRSTISDIEIDYKNISGPTKIPVPGYKKAVEFGVLHTFEYPLFHPNGDRQTIPVSTTRIETALGDVAVAVNPKDPRYSNLIGLKVRHPLLPGVTLPVIADSYVDINFGTGAVKITPGHDANDFDVGLRHDLNIIDILDDDGNINCFQNVSWNGIPRFKVRNMVIDALEKQGLYRGKEPHATSLPICSRSGDVVEQRIKTQWFVRTKNLAREAMKAVETGQIQIEPDSHLSAWNNWLLNNEDWCISRQLWWGHRIPAYIVTTERGEKTWVSAHTENEARCKAADLLQEPEESFKVSQDEDVLDTWFSSALFPFASFGWPEDTEDLKRFYPLSVMETGYDLLFFWVARMVMMGITLTGKVPFKTVYLHSMVRDAQGRKMSKSLGNVIDPLEVIYGCSGEELDSKIKSSDLTAKEEKYALRDRAKTLPHGIPECGTDALRFYLCLNKKSVKDLSLDVHSVVQYRYFCNKIWNVYKFLVTNVKERGQDVIIKNDRDLRPVDLWIRSRLYAVVDVCNSAFASLNFATAATNMHRFFFVDFADFYVESCKSVFTDNSIDPAIRLGVEDNLESTFETFLRLLSPFMPYITEELWQRLPNHDISYESVTVATYPSVENLESRNLQLEREIDTVRNTIQALRNIKQTFQLPNSSYPEVTIMCMDEVNYNALRRNRDVIKNLAKLGDCHISMEITQESEIVDSIPSTVPDTNITIHMKLKKLIDVHSQYVKHITNIGTTREKIQVMLERISKIENKDGKRKLFEKIGKMEQKLSELENIVKDLERLK